jgi:hypothetical protein
VLLLLFAIILCSRSARAFAASIALLKTSLSSGIIRHDDPVCSNQVEHGRDWAKDEGAESQLLVCFQIPIHLVHRQLTLPSAKRGLKYVADKRRQRVAAIADWIAGTGSSNSSDRNSRSTLSSSDGLRHDRTASSYDIIALQEIWVRADFDLVAARGKEAGLVYSRFFYRSVSVMSSLAMPWTWRG